MVGSLAGDLAVFLFLLSSALLHPRRSSFAATRRKSLRLTGSHGITGTRDIYASAPTDRSITRNKEIANLLQELTATLFGFSTLPTHNPPPDRPDLLPLLRYCPPSSRRGSESYFGFYGSRPPGSSGNVPDDGEKSCDQSGGGMVTKEDKRN